MSTTAAPARAVPAKAKHAAPPTTGYKTKAEADDAQTKYDRLKQTGKRLTRALIGICSGGLIFTCVNVTIFAVNNGVSAGIGWLLDPLVSIALVTVLWADGVFTEIGGYKARGWPLFIRMFAGFGTWIMNCWDSLYPLPPGAAQGPDAPPLNTFTGIPEHPHAAGILLHSIIPFLVIGLAEAIAGYRKFEARRGGELMLIVESYQAGLKAEAQAAADKKAAEEQEQKDRKRDEEQRQVEEKRQANEAKREQEKADRQKKRDSEAAELKRQEQDRQEEIDAARTERQAKADEAKAERDHRAAQAAAALQIQVAREEAALVSAKAEAEVKVISAATAAETERLRAEAEARVTEEAGKAEVTREQLAFQADLGTKTLREQQDLKRAALEEADRRQAAAKKKAETEAHLTAALDVAYDANAEWDRERQARHEAEAAARREAAEHAAYGDDQGDAGMSRQERDAERQEAIEHAAKAIILKREPTTRELGEMFGKGETWGRDRMKTARQMLADDPEFYGRMEDIALQEMVDADQMASA